MRRVPFFLAEPLRLSAAVASAWSVVLARYAEMLRALTGDEESGGSPATHTPQRTAARTARAVAQASARAGGPNDEPDRPDAEEHTLGRTAAERKEPTPEPARGASAAQASRRPSNPKAARAVRKRTTTARSITTVQADGGSGRGGTPAAPAENTPKARARAGRGRQPAPMGSQDAGDETS